MRDDIGKLILRLAIGGLMLFHGVAKLRTGVGGVARILASAHLPAFLAYGVFFGEVLAPVLLVLGLFVRPAAAIVALDMVVAIAVAHRKDIATITPVGGWAIELELLYLLGALAICFLGSGRFAFGGRGRFD